MDADTCLQALVRCHEQFSTENNQEKDIPCDEEERTGPVDEFSGPHIARRFAEEAAKVLTKEELDQLTRFLTSPKARNHAPTQIKSLAQAVQTFYEAEPRISGLSAERLTIPGGPEDADFCIILHLATGRYIPREFWNTRSATISLLEEKGINEKVAFGYDWHWRAEDASYLARSDCPVRKWPQELRQLHNQLSKDILDILPLPFIVTASGCTRDNIRKTLSPARKSFDIQISETTALKVDLDFREESTSSKRDLPSKFLRRLIIHVHHPASGFASTLERRPSMASQIDAGLNFVMWLTGQKHDATSFRRTYSQAGPAGKRPSGKRPAPLAEMYAYIRREHKEERTLELLEYTPSFLSWATRYLLQDPAQILARGHSVAGTVLLKIRRNMRIAHKNRPPQTKKRGKPPKEITTPETLFHGKTVAVLRCGAVKLSSPIFTLRFRMAVDSAKAIISLKEEPRIYFDADGIVLRINDRIVYQKPIERLLTSINGEEWLVQITNELRALTANCALKDGRPPTSLVVKPHDARLGARWKNGELQRKLIEGSIFPCTEMSNIAKVGRVYFRGVQLYIPREANFDTVFVQCDLVPEGLRHPNMCPSACEDGDPAIRLGIRIRYNTQGSNEQREYWAALKGANNTKILNSLVDFLEGKDEEWTESQPRRFLPRSVSRKRTKICYTT